MLLLLFISLANVKSINNMCVGKSGAVNRHSIYRVFRFLRSMYFDRRVNN